MFICPIHGHFKHVQIVNKKNTNTTIRGNYLTETELQSREEYAKGIHTHAPRVVGDFARELCANGEAITRWITW